jgi:hypothetical protein
MVTTALQKPATAPVFPAAEVDVCIRAFLADLASAEMDLGVAGSARMGFEPSIDSLVMVDLFVRLESKLSFELPLSLVQPGGYAGVDELVSDLVPKLEREWRAHHRESAYERKQ